MSRRDNKKVPRRYLNLTRLAAEEKRRLWEQMKTERPDLAAFVTEPGLQALMQALTENDFSPELIIEDFRHAKQN